MVEYVEKYFKDKMPTQAPGEEKYLMLTQFMELSLRMTLISITKDIHSMAFHKYWLRKSLIVLQQRIIFLPGYLNLTF